MSRTDSDHLHRSTLGIYSSLTDEFNPHLQKLVLLGNSYAQAFKALVVTSGDYFNALSKIGEKAFYTMSSHSLGNVLIQISESQQRLTLEMEDLFRQFSREVLQQMDNNAQLDRDYILGSRVQYEKEVHNRMRRGTNQDYTECMHFLRESHGEALGEEERRYRFLAERHCGLIQSIAQIMNKTGRSLQQRVDAWTKEINATRQSDTRDAASLGNTMGMREDELRRSLEEQPLGNIPSRAPSPQGSISRFSADSAGGGGRRGGGGGGGGGGQRALRARVAHEPPGSNPTLLPFSKGQLITALVQQPRNGWLYGQTDNGSRTSTLRSSSNMNNQPPPPPPPPSSSSKQSENRPAAQAADKRTKSLSQSKNSQAHGSQPELFPRGTNPFATVKLKPTTTNDRSAPHLQRR
ncbi:unnamed protein product [Menidia menidia]|uniref:(Atlantic silverside) hypothetical protein n=1 Tax=Menidia menidia TaxID=238744 RepID=A0A8S4AXI2_9TELE|nr:unnamed protein product [Menidia menidia]